MSDVDSEGSEAGRRIAAEAGRRRRRRLGHMLIVPVSLSPFVQPLLPPLPLPLVLSSVACDLMARRPMTAKASSLIQDQRHSWLQYFFATAWTAAEEGR